MSESPEVPDEEPVPVIDSDAKDNVEGGKEGRTSHLQQRLKDTGDALKDASRRFGMMTARFRESVKTEVMKSSKSRGQNQPIHSIWSRERKREKGKATGRKNRYAPRRTSGDGIIETLPDMVDLPTPEKERTSDKNISPCLKPKLETQLSIIEELQLSRMSSRLDDLERRNRALATPIPSVNESTSSKSPTKRMEEGQVVTEALVVLGASLLWVVTILGLDQVINEQGMTSVGKVRSARWFGP